MVRVKDVFSLARLSERESGGRGSEGYSCRCAAKAWIVRNENIRRNPGQFVSRDLAEYLNLY